MRKRGLNNNGGSRRDCGTFLLLFLGLEQDLGVFLVVFFCGSSRDGEAREEGLGEKEGESGKERRSRGRKVWAMVSAQIKKKKERKKGKESPLP